MAQRYHLHGLRSAVVWFLVAQGTALWMSGAGALAAAPSIDSLARDVERAESLRDVKNLQRTYAQYAQFGLWNEMASLFASDGVFQDGSQQLTGPAAIAKFLTDHDGNGQQGLPARAIETALIAAPVVNLSVDGNSAKGRWDAMILRSDASGNASIEGGIFENTYAREHGVWKFAVVHFYPLYAGSYESGWTNIDGKDLPIVPYHYDGDTAGVPIPDPVGTPAKASATVATLQTRIRVLNDEDRVRNLQSAYNYYVDRKMWDDVADLFANGGVLEIGGLGVYDGPKGVRRAMERMGPAGLDHGQLNDHLLFDDVAQILSGGTEARMRGYELGLVGEADKGEARWEVTVFDNRYVKVGDVWKVREMRLFPVFRSDYHLGWGKSREQEALPSGNLAPDHSVPAADRGAADALIPAFHAVNPVTKRPVALPAGKKFITTRDLTRPIAPSRASQAAGTEESRIQEAARLLAVSKAYDGAENVNSAYGHVIDDFKWTDMSKLFGKHGAKEVPFAGYYAGFERIARAVFLEYGDTQVAGRAGIAFHWLIQPVILVAADGRSARAHSYLFHPDTNKRPGGAGLFGAMYPDNQFVLEDGVWRFWNLSLDEPYFAMVGGWKGGWSGKAPPRPAGAAPAPLATPPVNPAAPQHYFGAQLVAKFAPDVPITALGKVEEHYRGGTGQTWDWPQILPMWWDFKNPVSDRTPENLLPDCIPCAYDPDMSMTRHGYLLPPTGREN
jgi:hypothetical protein